MSKQYTKALQNVLARSIYIHSYIESTGVLNMVNEADTVKVLGDFVMQSIASHSGKLKAGTLEVGGNLTQIGGSSYNFCTSGTHTVVFNGSEAQTISIANNSKDYSRFNNLKITNTSETGVTGIIVIRGSILNNNNDGYEKVNSILSKFANTHTIISASIRSEIEESWNETTDLSNVSKYHTDMSKIKTFIPVKMVTPIADIEQFPGHTHSYDGIWFGCSYEMWFGKDYNNYIPLKHINSFADCAVKEVYENGTIRIKMFDDINAYNSDEAVSRQFAFRRHTKCDEMADYWHERVKDLQREVNNESISIYEGKFEHGGVRLIKYYLDSNNNPTCRSEAVKVHIEERGTDGKNIFTETLPIDK